MCHANFGGRDTHVGRTGGCRCRWSAMVDLPLDRALINRLPTIPLTEAVWPQFPMQVFGMHTVPRLGEMEEL